MNKIYFVSRKELFTPKLYDATGQRPEFSDMPLSKYSKFLSSTIRSGNDINS